MQHGPGALGRTLMPAGGDPLDGQGRLFPEARGDGQLARGLSGLPRGGLWYLGMSRVVPEQRQGAARWRKGVDVFLSLMGMGPGHRGRSMERQDELVAGGQSRGGSEPRERLRPRRAKAQCGG